MLHKEQIKNKQNLIKKNRIHMILSKRPYLRLYSLNPQIASDNSLQKMYRRLSTVITEDEAEQVNEYPHNNHDSIAAFMYVTVDRDGNQYRFNTQQWTMFGQGADHFVFGNTNPQSETADKVLIFDKKNISPVDEQLHNHYLQDLAQNKISKFINMGIKVWPKNAQSKKALNLLKETKEGIDFSTQKFTIADNVLSKDDHQWDIILEFKPKSLAVSNYGIQTINSVAERFNIDPVLIEEELNKADIIQKLAWFKKVSYTSKKITICPLQLFAGIKYPQNPLNFLKTEFYKEITCSLPDEKINQLILQELRKSGVLQLIHKITSIYSLPNFYGLFPEMDTEYIPVSLPKLLKKASQKFNIQDTVNYLNTVTCIEQTSLQELQKESLHKKWERLYRLMIFRCWNDISLIVKIKLDSSGQFVAHSDIKIIDFELWQVKNLKKRTPSEKQYLQKYLQFKGVIFQGQQQQKQAKYQLLKKSKSYQKSTVNVQRAEIYSKNSYFSLLPKLQQMSTIKILILDRNNLQPASMKQLAQGKWANLQILSLNCNRIQAQGCTYLSRGEWLNLKVLRINSNRIKNEGLSALSQSCWSLLQECQLDWNGINEEGIQYLGRWKKLTKLSFRLWQVGAKGAKNLVDLDLPKLRSLDLYNNSVQVAGMEWILKSKWPQLQYLVLSKNHLRKQSFISNLHQIWPKLKLLDLSLNRHLLLGCDVLFKLNGSSLKELKICSNNITSESLVNITKVEFKHLQKLDLFNNDLKNQGFKVLCQVNWPHLQYLNLARNKISDYGLEFIDTSRFTMLRQLILYHNNVTLNGVKLLVSHAWQHLAMIDFNENNVTKAEVKKRSEDIQNTAKVSLSCLILD